MIASPMGSEFLDVCARIDPESESIYRQVAHECVATILGDEASAEVFLLALDLFTDRPSMDVLEQRTQLLGARFTAASSSKKGARS